MNYHKMASLTDSIITKNLSLNVAGIDLECS
jgi:hypothetical protein